MARDRKFEPVTFEIQDQTSFSKRPLGYRRFREFPSPGQGVSFSGPNCSNLSKLAVCILCSFAAACAISATHAIARDRTSARTAEVIGTDQNRPATSDSSRPAQTTAKDGRRNGACTVTLDAATSRPVNTHKRLAQLEQSNYQRVDNAIKAGRMMLDQGRWDMALEYFSLYCTNKPADPEGFFWQAIAFDESGNQNAAVNCYRAAIDRADRLGLEAPQAWCNLGNDLLKTGKVDEAKLAFEKAISIEPELVQARLNLARAQIEKAEYQLALNSLQQCSDLHYNVEQVAYYRVKALLKSGRIEEASIQLDKLLRQLPDSNSQARVKEEFKMIVPKQL